MSYDFSDNWFSANVWLFQRFLGDLKDRPCRLLEIGSSEGRSAIWLIDNIATHASSAVDTIDATESERLRHNLATSPSRSKITFHLGSSDVVLRTLPLESYDFAYIDGSHAAPNVLEDAIHAFRLLRVGGILAFDDYLWDDPNYHNYEGRPKAAIDAFLRIYSRRTEVLHRGAQVWLRKKSPAVPVDGNFMVSSTYRPIPLWKRASQRLRAARVTILGY